MDWIMCKPSRLVIGLVAFSSLGACVSRPAAVDPVGKRQVARIAQHGLVAEFNPAIDRLTFFGREHGANLLHVSDLGRDVPADGSYVFWGGCYTWVSPQKGEAGWVDADGTLKKDWPPDPAMDVGPAQRAGWSAGSFKVIGPEQRTGLREEKSFRIVSADSAELSYVLRNKGASAVKAGPWVTCAVGLEDLIAVRLPEGAEVWGWDGACVERFRSITGPADARGWALVDLSKADWEGGIKVYVGSAAEIAVWRSSAKAWLHRAMPTMSPPEAERLRAMGEGPVALYIQPNGGKDPIVEAELYGPIGEIAPGGTAGIVERWSVIEAERPDTALLR